MPDPIGGDDAADFLVGQHLVFARLVGVDDLAAQGEDRLEHPHAAPLGAAAGGIALDQVQLAAFHVAAGAIAELAGQAAAGEGPLAFADQGAGLAGALAGLGRQQPFLHDDLGGLGVLFEEAAQEVAHRRIDDPFHFAVAELGLGLALELRIGHPQRDHGRKPFAEIVAAGNQVLEEVLLLAIGVEGAGQRGLEARNVRAAFAGGDVVDEGVDVLGELRRILHGDFHAHFLQHRRRCR